MATFMSSNHIIWQGLCVTFRIIIINYLQNCRSQLYSADSKKDISFIREKFFRLDDHQLFKFK